MKKPNPLSPSNMGKTITIGEILVEIMATTKGHGFLKSQPFIGPFPSGAPAIFIDQVGKLGGSCGIIAAVGNDDFGQLNINRLQDDGVDVSAIETLNDYPTGTAFVRYQENGDRNFVFNISESAAGKIQSNQAIDNLIDQAGHLHIMGTALTLPGVWPIAKKALIEIKAKGGSISFDPNMREELGQSDETSKRIAFLLENTDLFMPSGDEVSLLSKRLGAGLGEGDRNELIQSWLENSNRELVLKQGKLGATYFRDAIKIERAAIPTKEVDATGAGDCFGATYLTCRRMGHPPETALEFANAAGHVAVTKQGPMEGNTSFAELQAILDSH